MKKTFALLLLAVILMTSCSYQKMENLDNFLPSLIDESTKYPYVESVTVVDKENDQKVTFTDYIDMSAVYMHFEGLDCKKSEEQNAQSLYDISFVTLDGAVTLSIISKSQVRINGTVYDLWDFDLDLLYFANLFD